MPLAGRHELPPLTMGDLSIAADELLRGLGGAGVMTEGDFEALIRMEVTFARKKGEYYACYEFGTAITPDSDQMMRIGTLAMVRLLLRCGSFRACYSKLSEASAAALRRKVAEPSGFAGLELEDTGYETLAALVAACRADGWVLDKAALDRPLFPGVDEATGFFLFTESFDVQRLCRRLIETGRQLGMARHKVGAWSLRKDACEQPASAGHGAVAARVLGHRQVNSRTMDRVYRADLRTRDLGAYWMRRDALGSVERAPLTSLSASRVPEVGGVRGFGDLPRACPERQAARSDAKVAEASEEVAGARRKLQQRLGVAQLPRCFKASARAAGGGEEVDEYEAAHRRLRNRKGEAERDAVEAHQLRLYKEGQERLRAAPALRMAMLSTHAWAPRSEDDAIAFGLDRRDRTRELRMLRKLPAMLQGSILRVGALHVLPTAGTPAEVYGRVRRRSEDICILECGSEDCAGRPSIEWPTTVAGFEERRCEHCGGTVRLRWQREPHAESETAAVESLAVGAAASLGESFRETYWAWYNLSARAAIGNAAYAAGAAATARASASEAADAPLLGAAVEELELDDETVAEAIAALDGGDGAPGRGDDADEDAGDHRGASQEV